MARLLGSGLALFVVIGSVVIAAPVAAQDELWGDDMIAMVDSLAEATLADGPVASLSIGLRRGDDVLMVKGYGLADIEHDVPATGETVYRIGSITKQFTAAAVMQLVEAGKIGLDDPITDYLPDYPTQGHDVTIRHLLQHTSGIKSYTSLEAWLPKMTLDLTDEELLALFKDEPFDFAPGVRFLYNNSGYYLLGMIIEQASGQTYREYLDDHLFEPLGLTGSSYCDERPIIPGRAEGYATEDGQLLNDAPLSMNQPGAAGALCSTTWDLLAWMADLREGEVVSRESYRLMTTKGILTDQSETGYGFGLFVNPMNGHPQIGHGGGINGFNTAMAYYPEIDLDVVVLSNTEGPSAGSVSRLIAKRALGVPIVLDASLSVEELAVYEGVYELRPGFELSIVVRGRRLFSQATGQSRSRLRAQGNHVFIPTFDDDVRLVFQVEDGLASSLVLHQGGQTLEGNRIR
jgi:D-alanyl-D-alanine carboxypeptidase